MRVTVVTTAMEQRTSSRRATSTVPVAKRARGAGAGTRLRRLPARHSVRQRTERRGSPARSCWAMKSRAKSSRSVPMHAGLTVGDRVCSTQREYVCGCCSMCRTDRETLCPDLRFPRSGSVRAATPNTSWSATTIWCICRTASTSRPAPSWRCAVGTAFNAVCDTGRVRPGERVLDCGRRRTRHPRHPDCTRDRRIGGGDHAVAGQGRRARTGRRPFRGGGD